MKRTVIATIILMFVSCGPHWRDAMAWNDHEVNHHNNYGGAGGQGGQGGQGGAGGNGYGGAGGNATGGNGYGGNATASGGNVSINTKYDDLREMAVLIGATVTSALRFKEGAHSEITDSRVMKVSEIVAALDSVDYEEAKRGRGANGDIKIIDSLIRPQVDPTNRIKYHTSKTVPSNARFIGFLTGICAINDADMANVVYAIGERAMEAGATDVVLIKESATEWGDTTGYAFDLGGFVTSIIGGTGSRAIGPGGYGGAGINGMKGGSADRSDAKFALYVNYDQLQFVSTKYQQKEQERLRAEAKAEAERKAKIEALQKQLDDLKK